MSKTAPFPARPACWTVTPSLHPGLTPSHGSVQAAGSPGWSHLQLREKPQVLFQVPLSGPVQLSVALCVPGCVPGGGGAPSTRKPARYFPVRPCGVRRPRRPGRRVLGCACLWLAESGSVSTALGRGSEHFPPVASCSLPSQLSEGHVPRPAIDVALRVSWLWQVGMQQAGKLGLWTKLPQGEQAGPMSLLWCHSLERKAQSV